MRNIPIPLLILMIVLMGIPPLSVEAVTRNPVFDMDGYWWLDDDASGLNVEDNTGYSAGNTAQETHITDVAKGTNVRLRIDISETANQTTGTLIHPRLEYQSGDLACTASGTWTTITTSTSNHWALVDSTTITDGDLTDSDRITGNAKPIVLGADAGKLHDTTNPSISGAAIANKSNEWEFSIEATSAASDSQVYTFRVTNSGTVLNAYSLPTANDCPNATTTAAATAPTVSTNAATGVTVSSAILNGTVSNDGGDPADIVGFAYGTDSTLATVISTTTESGTFATSATFDEFVQTLQAGVTYYFRAYAINETGTGIASNILNFTVGTDNTPRRVFRLFEGFVIRLMSGRITIFGK